MTNQISVKHESSQVRNMKVLEQIEREAQQNPEKWCTGQWVVLLHRNVVATSSDWKAVVAAVDETGHDRQQTMLFRIGDDYDEVERMM